MNQFQENYRCFQIAATSIIVLADVPGLCIAHGSSTCSTLLEAALSRHPSTSARPWAWPDCPAQTWNVNLGWMLVANLADDLHARTKLLGLADYADLVRRRTGHPTWHLPARLAIYARARALKIPADSLWANAFTTSWTCWPPYPARPTSIAPDSNDRRMAIAAVEP